MMTKEDWDKVEQKMQSPFGSIHLLCDGYDLHLHTCLVKRRLMISFFVDGWSKGEWMLKDCEERRRFHRKVVCSAWGSKTKKAMSKVSKKTLKSLNMDLDATYNHYSCFWLSFRPLKAHLIKNNASIELKPEV